MKRSEFIKTTSFAAAGITILNFPVFGKNAPSTKVVVAVMGVNGRGAHLASSFSKLQNVEWGISVMLIYFNSLILMLRKFTSSP